MEALTDYLLEYGQLNSQQIALIQAKAKLVSLQKEAYFSEAGKIANQVGFVQEGILRVCYFNKQGDEVTRYFLDENHFVVDLNSYSYRLASSEYVQAVTDCQLVVFSRERFDELSATIIGWDEIISKITTKALLDKVSRTSPMLAEDATDRYHHFLERFPLMANRIPLSHLASYLGITPSSLSRIRRKP